MFLPSKGPVVCRTASKCRGSAMSVVGTSEVRVGWWVGDCCAGVLSVGPEGSKSVPEQDCVGRSLRAAETEAQ